MDISHVSSDLQHRPQGHTSGYYKNICTMYKADLLNLSFLSCVAADHHLFRKMTSDQINVQSVCLVNFLTIRSSVCRVFNS